MEVIDLSEATSIEKFKIVNNQWAKAEDVCKLTGFSKSKAYKIINELHKEILEEGRFPVARGVVSMNRVLKHLGISKDEIYTAALREKELFGLEFATEAV
jgi:predicted DNA-binding transcriptional regulator AlpA